MPVNTSSASYKRARKNFNTQMDRRIQAITERFKGKASIQAMEKAVDILAAEALELTPRETGALQESQYKRVFVDGDNIIGVVGYDVSKAPYAFFVHQIPADHSQANFPNNPPRAQWRFLSTALDNTSQQIIQTINRSRGSKEPGLGRDRG